ALLIAEPALAFAHTGGVGVIVGLAAGLAAYVYADDLIPEKTGGESSSPPAPATQASGQPGMLYRLLNGKSTRGEQDAEDSQERASDEETVSDDDPLFARPDSSDTAGIERLTIEQIVEQMRRQGQFNGYHIWIGRSLTKEGSPAVLISFFKQHFRFMGASQRGKSSMLGAFLEIITRTHDTRHVRLILLDKENRTSQLFAHLPHVLSMKKADGRVVKLHARNEDEVLEYLLHTVAIMKHRYTLPQTQAVELPVILVYIEEFLALKNEFKIRISKATTREQREQAESDYATLVYCIELLSQMGLKARIQLLLCAQVEYADDDFKEALVNVQCGFAFCVRPTAAASAGFFNHELIRRNAKKNKVGQAVVETPDCNDLVLSPAYDLDARLLAFEKTQVRPQPEPMHIEDYARMRAPGESPSSAQNEADEMCAYARTNEMRQPGETAHHDLGERTFPRLTDEQIPVFIGAYKVSGNKDKSLQACGANTRYRAHADEIILEHHLKKEGA
ncbi:MAG TPA: FtsK/SpoIIIE domain-containing protein, partial [Ktedonosporobacter sp.]|nr:FtsK/SpoIIIE domain-containing protein [Ktedonosporobacter sp.]